MELFFGKLFKNRGNLEIGRYLNRPLGFRGNFNYKNVWGKREVLEKKFSKK
jgi:hypothetical protein